MQITIICAKEVAALTAARLNPRGRSFVSALVVKRVASDAPVVPLSAFFMSPKAPSLARMEILALRVLRRASRRGCIARRDRRA